MAIDDASEWVLESLRVADASGHPIQTSIVYVRQITLQALACRSGG
jgi:hypothetical protein